MTDNTQTLETTSYELPPVAGINPEIVETHATTEHTGPHIPLIQGEPVWGPISNVTITTILFLGIVLGVAVSARNALRSNKQSKLKTFFLHFTKFFDDQLRDAFQDKDESRKYFGLVVGMFFIIFFGNLFGLVVDWITMSTAPQLASYVRPIHSDLNTTLVLALVVVVMMLVINIQSSGGLGTLRNYFFNARGNNIGEKGINVFVGWLHTVGVGSTLASLSLRLFGNIFAGIVLIGVISFLMASATSHFFEVGRIFTIPFWFFEVFVALVQAIVFSYLMIAYFKGASEHH